MAHSNQMHVGELGGRLLINQKHANELGGCLLASDQKHVRESGGPLLIRSTQVSMEVASLGSTDALSCHVANNDRSYHLTLLECLAARW